MSIRVLAVQVSGKVTLTPSHLMSVDRLIDPTDRDPEKFNVPSVTLRAGQQQAYIGKDDLKEILTTLRGHYDASDTSRPGRVPPMVITRFARGGKTRMMKELAASLQKEGIPALLITFNDETTVSEDEKMTMTPLESIGVRIAWATATDCTLQEVAKAAKKSVDCLMFGDWVDSVCISKKTLADWLGNHPLAIFIDELNHRIAPNSTFLPKSGKDYTHTDTHTHTHTHAHRE